MDAYFVYLNELVNKNKVQFSGFPNLKWLNAYSATDYQAIRNQLMDNFRDSTLFQGTKPFYNQISPGCKLCGAGLWSCLFITGKCNASCFYCPASQNIDEVPESQGLTFPTAASYAEYISHFKFKGVAFSGGEPLLYFKRVLEYLGEIRENCDPVIYIWMYTNGLLASEAIFKELANKGLNEVRFDIGATGYKLDKVRLAKGIIKNVTIEIPAVPEEKELLKALLPQMIKEGVTNLNLHQLRLTEYNVTKLSKHNYTYIPAEKPLVLESELAALEIMEYAQKHQLDIGINYCSFFFKNRFQAAGFRNRVAEAQILDKLSISQKGYIRNFNKDEITYSVPKLTDDGKLNGNSQKLELLHKKYNITTELIHKQCLNEKDTYQQITDFLTFDTDTIPSDPILFEIWRHEFIEKGLREY